MASNTFSKTVTDWDLLVTTVAANSDDLAHLEPIRLDLSIALMRTKELGVQQDRQQSETQQTSRVIEETMRQGEALAARLRAGIRAKYGYQSEKLTEFQLRPIRRRFRMPEAPQPEAPAPDPSSDPSPESRSESNTPA